MAVEYMYRNHDRYSIIWWVRAGKENELIEDLAELCHRLGLRDIGDLKPEQLAYAVKSELERRSDWLLIFDNADDPRMVSRFLPSFGDGRSLVTSRNPNWQDIGGTVKVTSWGREESVEFLSRRTGRPSGEGAGKLAADLGDLPLALAQAAAYMAANGTSFDQYRDLIRSNHKQLWKDEVSPLEYEHTVATTWTISIRRVSADVRHLLRLFAMLGSGPFSRLKTASDLLNARLKRILSNVPRLRKAIGMLQSYSLIEASDDFYMIHPLVSVVVLDHSATRWPLRVVIGVPATAAAVVLLVLLIHWSGSISEDNRRKRCANNLRQIGLALNQYVQEFGVWPWHTAPELGSPLSSWRVSILPYLGERELFESFKLNESWNSEHNLRVARRMPEVYRCPSDIHSGKHYQTNYLAIIRSDVVKIPPTMLEYLNYMNVPIVGEVRDSHVLWTEPEDLVLGETGYQVNDPSPKPSISSQHQGGANVLLGDSKVFFLGDSTKGVDLKRLLDPYRNEVRSTDVYP
jgi:hypothetical protein